MKYFFTILVVLICISCNNNKDKRVSILFEKQIQEAINTYGDSLFNHFPTKLSITSNEKDGFNAMYRLQYTDTVDAKYKKVEPIFLFYGTQEETKKVFEDKKKNLLSNQAAKMILNTDSIYFYIFDYDKKDNKPRITPYFSKAIENTPVKLNESLVKQYVEYNTEMKFKKRYPMPLFNDTIILINGYNNYVLSKNLLHYIIDAKKEIGFKEILAHNTGGQECLPPEWEHGYTRGFSVSERDNYILYWLLIW